MANCVERFVVLCGTQSSGSSAIAGLAYHVGVWMGNRLGGRYGNNPDRHCGYEDKELLRLVTTHCKFAKPLRNVAILRRDLKRRVRHLQRVAAAHGYAIAGGKLPRLSYFGDVFKEICGDGLYVIGCDRPLADAIQSTTRLMPAKTAFANVQRWLLEGKEALLASMPEERRLRVDYYKVTEDPRREALRIAAFLGLTPTEEELAKAASIVHRRMQHFGPQA